MIRLYIGGAYQGQEALAARENPEAELVAGFHEMIWEAVNGGEEAEAFTDAFCREHPDAILVADEVGSGIVPLRAEDRAYREAVGRGLCAAAARAEWVTRVMCGIGVRIK